MLPATYRALLRTPGATAFFSTATAGRVGIAMTSLGLVWLVHGRTGSYAVAGLVTGAFAVAEALAGPQLGRLLDRFGQTRMLPPVLLAHVVAVTTLLALVSAGSPAWLMTATGAAAGATIPQLGALSAARWSALLRGGRAAELPAAFTLESLANAVAYLAGPVVVSAVGASGHPELGTALAAGLVVTGGLALAAQRRTAPATASEAGERRRAGRSLLRPGFAVIAALNLAVGVFFGAMQVSVTAFAVEHGAPAAAAPLYAASSCGGLLTGWLYGLRRLRVAPRTQLVLGTSLLAGACLPLLVADSLPGAGVAIALTGTMVTPILTLSSMLTESAVHPYALTQAFAWLSSASSAGSAAAAAAAGHAVDAAGAHGGFAIASAATATMTVLALAGWRTLHVRTEAGL
ncbi:MFS transporter [Nonomuraea sp. KC401]|uniref:MFS transporter n=2 Tax=Nonomuraea TaxID=83681 RepID=UPI0010FD0958|nr:MFS transporter [Nonomuraea sp. KC401]NBE99964.1 MFS transporter [Nonomuraea sp. K271]TLF54790.1 MFS transporter [Nonomuraea sp. KC401]